MNSKTWSFTTFPRGPKLTTEEQWWFQQVELPLDIDHSCQKAGSTEMALDTRRERRCPACQYVRGFKDGQKHAE